MATDTERQAKTDEIVDQLEILKTLADEAFAMDMIAQLNVDGKNFRLDLINPQELKTYLDKTFEPTPEEE
jgi:hypothetical protein